MFAAARATATRNRTRPERGFPDVDQWKRTPVHYLASEKGDGFEEVAQGPITNDGGFADGLRSWRALTRQPWPYG